MERVASSKHQNPRQNAGFISRIFFLWMIPLCVKSTKKVLNIFDLYETLPFNNAETLANTLENNWTQHLLERNSSPNLLKVLFRTYFFDYWKLGLVATMKFIFIANFQLVILSKFIESFSASHFNSNIMFYGSYYALLTFTLVFFNNHIEYEFALSGMRVKIALSSLIYRKLLKSDKKALSQYSAGQIVNMLTSDVGRFETCAMFLNYLWILPVQLVIITYYLWTQIHVAIFVGLGFCIFCMLIMSVYVLRWFSQRRHQSVQVTDTRIKLMKEIISGIEVIKMYAWEGPFERIIKQIRKVEMKLIGNSLMLKSMLLSATIIFQKLALFVTIATYTYLGNRLTSSVIFPLYQSFNIIQTSLGYYLPTAILNCSDTLIALRRIEQFLLIDTKPAPIIQTKKNIGIFLDNVAATWNKEFNSGLIDINLSIPKGCFCAVVGPVGAGKSSLLQLLLGELIPSQGLLKLGGHVAYSSQEPWLFSSSVRNNILFGMEYDANKYEKIVRVCALEKDFHQLPNGDESLVGDNGISLSGGQKARINLARAVYREADIYLLDDPLSAVDARVGKHLFDECILNYLGKKTRVLVTHQLQFLKKADLIVVVNEGRIEAKGSFDELSRANLDFTKLLISCSNGEAKGSEAEEIGRKQSIHLIDNVKYAKVEEIATETASSPFKDYLLAATNGWTIVWLIILGLLAQISLAMLDVWLAYLIHLEYQHNTSELLNQPPMPNQIESPLMVMNMIPKRRTFLKFNIHQKKMNLTSKLNELSAQTSHNSHYNLIKTNVAIYIYFALLIVALILIPLRNVVLLKSGMKSSKHLHKSMLHSVLSAPKKFFDINGCGKILDRFSKDLAALDELIPFGLIIASTVIYTMFGISLILVFANVYITLPLIFMLLLFLQMSKWYISTSKSLKQIESATKSPIISHVTATVGGLGTIRVNSKEAMLRHEFDCHQNTHTSSYYLLLSSKACFGLWFGLISSLLIALVIYSFIALSKFRVVSDSIIGLAITQTVMLTTAFQVGIKQIVEFVNDLVIVERIVEYKNVRSEEDFGSYMNPSWPTSGQIVFENLSLAYSKLQNSVLKNVNFVVEPMEKIGIVGRTGAGKSSLINALFRLVSFQGNIFIDGIDSKLIKLHDLRKRISIIPQNPILFSATLRYNLDPLNEFIDEKVWNALEQVQMRKSIPSLELLVEEGGSNFSIGQRQLLCLARAILRNNKILVLDEATANVDAKTDALIQQTIRRQFKACTVITIAHRLNTIMDADKVLVMEDGRVVEFGHPYLLLENKNGYLSQMVRDGGVLLAKQFKDATKQTFLK